MLERGDTLSTQAMLEAWLLRHAPPVARYDSAATGNLYSRLAAIYWHRGDTLLSGTIYDAAYPYMQARDDSTQSDLLRFSSYALRENGRNARALHRILQSMRVADAAGDSVRFEKALVCWRSMMDEEVTVSQTPKKPESISFFLAIAVIALLIRIQVLKNQTTEQGCTTAEERPNRLLS